MIQRNTIRSPLFIAMTTLCASTGYAADPEYGLSGSGEAGYSGSTGNTVEESLSASIKLKYLQKYYEVNGLLEANNKTENHIQTQERYVGDLQSNFFFSSYQKAYSFAQGRWENDRFANIDLNSYYIAGLGYNLYKEKNLVLAFEAGLGYQNMNYSPGSPTGDFDQKIGKASAKFEYGFSPNVRFLQDLSEFYGERQANFESNSAIKVKLNGHLR
ncbi:MAG: DUF481 domain-containing protein, partial [Hydrogenovibrio sp.]|nr:DUF481 domain-containing protein [Hydrogenovibrio sp.]